jgi:phosphopantothenoylcysteine synthetase/decarboxylase
MNVSNVYRIVQTASLFDKESYDQWLNSMKELKNVLETTNLKELLDTLGDDSEGAKEIINQLRDMATENVRKEFENEAAKFEKAAKLQGESEEDQDLDDEDDSKVEEIG